MPARELCVIMGVARASKGSLLNVLAGRSRSAAQCRPDPSPLPVVPKIMHRLTCFALCPYKKIAREANGCGYKRPMRRTSGPSLFHCFTSAYGLVSSLFWCCCMHASLVSYTKIHAVVSVDGARIDLVNYHENIACVMCNARGFITSMVREPRCPLNFCLKSHTRPSTRHP